MGCDIHLFVEVFHSDYDRWYVYRRQEPKWYQKRLYLDNNKPIPYYPELDQDGTNFEQDIERNYSHQEVMEWIVPIREYCQEFLEWMRNTLAPLTKIKWYTDVRVVFWFDN